MNRIKRIKSFINWLSKESLGKDSVESVYDDLAKSRTYDKMIKYEARKNVLRNSIKDYDFSDKSILDLACGTGVFIDALSDTKNARIVGVDLSNEMLKIAKDRLQHIEYLELVKNSFLEVEFHKNSFDYILMANASRFIPKGQEQLFFNNVLNWLKDDGIFFIVSDFLLVNEHIGRPISEIYNLFANKENFNPNTAWDHKLKRFLKKYFEIVDSKYVNWMNSSLVNHKIYFCNKTNI